LLFRHHARALRGEEVTAAREQTGHLTPFDGVLADPDAIAIAGGHFGAKMTSATRIAKYAKCPRQYFLSSVLNLSEEEEPDDILEMQVSTRGTVIHAVLEEFLATNPPGDIEHGNRGALVDQMFALTERHFDVQVRKGKAGRPGLHDRTCEDIAAECVAWLDHMLGTDEFRPDDQFQLEYAFSGLVVPTSRGDIRFRGFIDRLGRHGDGTFSVLDYKTGRVLDLEDGEIGDGQDLQLPLYMLAGAEALAMPVEAGSASYEFVSRRNGYVRITLTGRELLAHQARFHQVMDGIADGVASGDFHAQPSDDACRYCDFKLLCGTHRIAMAELKESDPHVATFRREVRGETGDAS
jgi:RecB family exonuclease